DDAKAARENLMLLKAKPGIASAAIYNARGRIFASYSRADDPNAVFPSLPESAGSRIEGSDVVLFKRVVENNEILGTVYLKGDYAWLKRLQDYGGIFAIV